MERIINCIGFLFITIRPRFFDRFERKRRLDNVILPPDIEYPVTKPVYFTTRCTRTYKQITN